MTRSRSNNEVFTQTNENEFVDSTKKRKMFGCTNNLKINDNNISNTSNTSMNNDEDMSVKDFESDNDSNYEPSKEELDKSSSSSSENESYNEIPKITKKKKRSELSKKRRESFIVYSDEEDETDEENNIEDTMIDLTENKEEIQQMILKVLKNKLKPYSTTINNTNIEETFTEEEESYFKSLSQDEQTIIKSTYSNIIQNENSPIPIKFQIINANISNYLKNIALQKYNTLMQMEDSSQNEYNKLNNWINVLCKIPFGKYQQMPITFNDSASDIKSFLINTKSILQEEVYGHIEAKEQILRIVAQWISNPNLKGNVIGIHGNPGVGKTTLIKNGVCKALKFPFASIPLGGANDSSFLEGHSYTYEGSTNGKILDILIQNKIMNPVLYFDELDKVSESKKGQDIINLLIHLTDPSQNSNFQDKYFNNIDFDLSKCLIIFTYNNNELINPILKDRMITIHTKDYNIVDKTEIAKHYLIPSIKSEFNIKDIEINDEDIIYIINKTKKEAGVRNLKRSIECVISNVNLARMLDETSNELPIKINKEIINLYLTQNDDINPSIQHLYT